MNIPFGLLALLALLSFPSVATAILVATPAQRLCGSSYVVVGTVVTANYSELSVKVTELIGEKNNVRNFPEEARIPVGKTVSILRTDEMSEAFGKGYDALNGKNYLFSISIYYGDVIDLPSKKVTRNYLSPPPYHALMWPPKERAWAVSVLEKGDGNSCPKFSRGAQ